MLEAPLPLDSFGMTAQGRDRRENQDQFLIGSLSKRLDVDQTTLNQRQLGDVASFTPPGRLLLVADGVGGRSAGRRASALAGREVTQQILRAVPFFPAFSSSGSAGTVDELRRAVREADESVVDSGHEVDADEGMATTLTLAWLVWPKAFVVHVGDSRCYLLRRCALRRLTQDHSLENELKAQGVSTVPSALAQSLVNVVGGPSAGVEPEAHEIDLEPGDLLLLCTDGLTKGLKDRHIERLLNQGGSAKERCERLLDAALKAGGHDDTTLVVCQSPRPQPSARAAAPSRTRATSLIA